MKYPVISGCVSILGPLKGHDEFRVDIFQAEDSSSLEALAFRLLRELWKDNFFPGHGAMVNHTLL